MRSSWEMENRYSVILRTNLTSSFSTQGCLKTEMCCFVISRWEMKEKKEINNYGSLKQRSVMPTLPLGIALLCFKVYACSARRGLLNRRKATRAMLTDRATPMAKRICGGVQRPTRA